MSKSGRYPRLFAAAFACLALFPVLVRAQTTIDLSGATRTANGDGTYTYDTWKPILAPQGWTYSTADGYLYDPNNDQQTGQSDSDFAGTAQLPSFFIQTGKIDGVDVIAFRVIFNAFDSGIASKKYNGNPVNVRVGVDANFDGKIDLFMGPDFQNGNRGVSFQLPGTGANISPSTTTTSSVFYPDDIPGTLGGGTTPAFGPNNFSYIELNTANAATYYPGWTTQPENNGTKSEGMMSWAIPIADINKALAEAAIASASTNPTLAGTTITAESLLLWVAFTATQNNSVNQDAYGITKNDPQDTRWDSFTSYMDAYGRPIPEASAYGMCLGAGLGVFLLLRRRRRPVLPV
jgi:hypothetical protein